MAEQVDMRAFLKLVKQERAEMTPEPAIELIRTAAEILGKNDYFAAEYWLKIVAEWLKKSQVDEKPPETTLFLGECKAQAMQCACCERPATHLVNNGHD